MPLILYAIVFGQRKYSIIFSMPYVYLNICERLGKLLVRAMYKRLIVSYMYQKLNCTCSEVVCTKTKLIAPNTYLYRLQAQQAQELPGVGERGGPLPRHRHGAGRQHEANLRALLPRTQGGTHLYTRTPYTMTLLLPRRRHTACKLHFRVIHCPYNKYHHNNRWSG